MADELYVEEVDVRAKMWIAIQMLHLHDRYLVDESIGEWAISHRLAVYLEQQFRCWNVDCEFNRNGHDPKLGKDYRDSKRPDIIVHRRGKDGPDLFAVEVKKQSRIDSDDREKVQRYVNELDYRFAACRSVSVEHVRIEWHGIGMQLPTSESCAWTNLGRFVNVA